MKRMLFVMNPYAGQKKASKYLPEVISIFNRAGYEVVIHMTEGQGDAIRVVEQRAGNADLVVCCGGDGTFNETITGLSAAAPMCLWAIFPPVLPTILRPA